MTQQTAASDIVYDLVSVQYHALKASQLYGKFIEDAGDNQEVVQFLQQCKSEDDARAQRVHQLLSELTANTGIKV